MKDATRITISVYGALVGIMGIEHGIGEVLQGNAVPEDTMILSWPESPFFEILTGEPAMTIVPNFFVTGILAILFSLAYLVWATTFVQKKHGGLVLILLSAAMLLAGGGFGPPLLGTIVGLTGIGFNVLQSRRQTRPAAGSWRRRLWLGAFVASSISWLMLFPGTVLIDHFWGVGHPELFVPVVFFCAMGFLLLTIAAGFWADGQSRAAGSAGIAGQFK